MKKKGKPAKQSPSDDDIRILALAGSFRKVSLNQALIQTAREPATLADLSAELGVSRERVRQLQRDAERKLTRPRVGP